VADKEFVFWKKGATYYARDVKTTRKEAFEISSTLGDALPWSVAAVTQDPAKPAAPAPVDDDGHGHSDDDGHGH
jgi:hypothetical protein